MEYNQRTFGIYCDTKQKTASEDVCDVWDIVCVCVCVCARALAKK